MPLLGSVKPSLRFMNPKINKIPHRIYNIECIRSVENDVAVDNRLILPSLKRAFPTHGHRPILKPMDGHDSHLRDRPYHRCKGTGEVIRVSLVSVGLVILSGVSLIWMAVFVIGMGSRSSRLGLTLLITGIVIVLGGVFVACDRRGPCPVCSGTRLVQEIGRMIWSNAQLRNWWGTGQTRDADGAIDTDLKCEKCGYNVRKLKPGYPCPECGTLIPQTMLESAWAWLTGLDQKDP